MSAEIIRCPECGRAVEDRSFLQPDRPLHWRVVVPGLVTLASIAAVSIVLAAKSFSGTTGDGTPRTDILDPGFTIADVHSIAEGQVLPRAISLTAAIKKLLARRAESDRWSECVIDVGFFPASGDRNTSFEIGWPATWYSRRDRTLYDDAMGMTGIRPLHTDRDPRLALNKNNVADPHAFYPGHDNPPPRARWSWEKYSNTLCYRPPVEETGGIEVWKDWRILNITSSAGLVVLVWALTGVAFWLWSVVLRRKRIRAGWIQMSAALAAAIVVACLAKNTQTTREEGLTNFEIGSQAGPLSAVYWVKSSVAHTTLRSGDIAGLAESPDSDVLIANAILAAVPQKSKTSGFLGIELTPTTIVTNGRVRSFGSWLQAVSYQEYQLTRRPDLGQTGFVANLQPGGLHLTRFGSIEYTLVPDDPALPTKQWSFSLPSMGILAIVLGMVWLLSVAACRWTQRLITRYRRRRGRCVACGYQVLLPVSTAT